MYYIIIVLVFVIDQLSKYFILLNMVPGQSIPLIEGVFHLTFVRNTGAAFSNFQDQRWGLILVTSIVLGVLLIFFVRKIHQEHWSLLLAIALIIGGGLGNLLDRIRLGYVVDMFDFHFWPVFNVADMAVVIGCGFLILNIIWLGKEHENKRTS
jgi:signal peptidase II